MFERANRTIPEPYIRRMKKEFAGTLLWNCLSAITCLTLSSLPSTAEAYSCYQSTIKTPTPFMGNNDEIFVLADDSVWQVKYEYLYEYYPVVTVCPDRGKLIVAGKELSIASISSAQHQPAKARVNGGEKRANKVGAELPRGPAGDVIESQVDGEFEGWEGETIVRLMNG